MKQFNIPLNFTSSILDRVKSIRTQFDPRKKDFEPSLLDFSNFKIYLPRHFGFCFGVQNAVEKAYSIINAHPNKRIFMISEMIHNPGVNKDLKDHGLHFIQDTEGNQLISWDTISKDDIVIIPAFGTSLEVLELLKTKEIQTEHFDTTCPFVERVWNKVNELSQKDFTLVIHGTIGHEETRATFSRMAKNGNALIVENIQDAQKLADYIRQQDFSNWENDFGHKCSPNFKPESALKKVAVINQTTMLADETKGIAQLIESAILTNKAKGEFANTRDTLCYATNDNQQANLNLLEHQIDLALVVGGFNSSNTSHLAEIHSKKHLTYFIDTPDKIDTQLIRHYNLSSEQIEQSEINWTRINSIAIISGASCPDSVIEHLIRKVLSIKGQNADIEGALKRLEQQHGI